MIEVHNAGPEILSTNFFDLPEAAAGKLFLTTNAATFRLLVPDAKLAYLAEMKTAVEAIVSRGPWPAASLQDAIEILFDDHSDSPFALQLGIDSLDRLPPASDSGRWVSLTVWRRGPKKELTLPCGFRMVSKIPCLQPWAGSKR
jgi:hypothetical protein